MSEQWSPYAPPQAEAKPQAGGAVYTPNQIALATFVGSTLAGTVLLAMNERRLGRPEAVVPTVALGLFASVALMGFSAALPDNVPTLPFAVIGIFGIRGIAHVRQHERIQKHLAAGGRRGSGWTAFGIGMVGLVVVLAVIVTAGSLLDR
jgi:hypothetical protein